MSVGFHQYQPTPLLSHHVKSERIEEPEFVVKLRGLPWTATQDDILDFFGDCTIRNGKDGIHLIQSQSGRASGEAFVELIQDEDFSSFQKKDRQTMGHRYIEVFKAKRAELEWYLKKNHYEDEPPDNYNNYSNQVYYNEEQDFESCVRLRGLPYECTREDILQFFEGLEIVPNGIQLMVDNMGRSSGEAYVRFTSKDQAERALAQDRQCIGHRYIETFRVGAGEMRAIQSLVQRHHSGGRHFNRLTPYELNMRNPVSGRGRGNGNGMMRPPPPPPGREPNRTRYFSKGFEEDSWFGNETQGGLGQSGHDSWNRGNGLPPPLIPGLRKGMPGRGGGGMGGNVPGPGPRFNRQGPMNTGPSQGYNCVLMRGLPFKATEDDIRDFFAPLVPTAVDIIYESSGRPSGTAKVQFANGDDRTRAMGKHKERMEHRYIELFIHN